MIRQWLKRLRLRRKYKVGDKFEDPQGKDFVIYSISGTVIVLHCTTTDAYYAATEQLLGTWYTSTPDSGV